MNNTFKFNGMKPKIEPKASTKEQIKEECRAAYYVCWGNHSYEESEKIRNLNFRSSGSLRPADWFTVMKEVAPQYNGFDAEKVYDLIQDQDIRIIPSREGSVCLYVIYS